MALLITNAEVASLLTMEDAIDAVEEAFRQLALGGASMPPRISTPPPEGPGAIGHRRGEMELRE
jgi:ornithine cyclodeaminase/alanine dehydrogenase-like protein (mu-crystallin family)